MSPQNWSELSNVGGPRDGVYFLYFGEKVGIYKKRNGWDKEPLWLKFWRKDGVFQWIKTDEDPVNMMVAGEPIVQREDNLYWNFIIRDTEIAASRLWSEKIDVKFFTGDESVFTAFELNVSWNGEGFLFGFTDETFQGNTEFNYEFYTNAYPLRELPDSTLIQQPVEGWTCLDEEDEEEDDEEEDEEDDEEEDEEDDEEEDEGGRFITGEEESLITTSVYAIIQENKRLKEELETKNLMIQQLTEETSSESVYSDDYDDYDDAHDYDEYADEIYQERRIDPFDKELYTKEEFQDYYGYDGFGDAMWDMNHPDKVSKVLMYEWILSRNSDVLSTKSKNYIMDKMIETLCS
jgi:hypothetical protein